jgi:glycosyltransferase involved in cell wall biosynthesis
MKHLDVRTKRHPIPLVLCITELRPGGAEKNLVYLATRVDRAKFIPHVVSIKPAPDVHRARLLTKLLAAGIQPEFLAAHSWWHLARTLKRLTHFFRQTQTAIVQSFLFHANFLARIAARLAGVRAVAAGIRVAEKSKQWHLRLEGLTSGWVDRFVCVSRAVAQYIQEKAGIPPHKIVVIPNGIDIAECDQTTPVLWEIYGIPSGADVILYIGRLDAQKGIDRLLEVAPEFLEPGPELDPHLVILGDGPLRAQVEANVRNLSRSNRIHFLGWHPEPLSFLRSASLLVLPSRWEGMPNVILEAMGCGKPVVATQVEGVQELLGEESELQIVPQEQWAGFAARVKLLLGEKALRLKLGTTNRARAARLFSVERMVDAYQNLWEDLIHSRGSL